MTRAFLYCTFLACLALPLQAKELAGVSVEDRIINSNNEALVLNGMGIREKFWIDVYVGSLYLAKPANNIADIIAQPTALRIQLDIIYSEIKSEKLIEAWKQGFEKNQSEQRLRALQSRIEQFNRLFAENAKKTDRYVFDYLPDQGTNIIKNNVLLGNIEGRDFRDAMVEIWLGNHPADKGLKKGMLGLK